MIATPSMSLRRPALLAALAIAALAGGCAGDGGGLFTTGSISEPVPMAKAAVDPACTTLASQIDGLRKEGTVDRLEKAADGKTSTVSVQRASLSKQAQLNKANADFIAKCGSKSTVAALAAPAAVAAPAAAAAPVKAAAAVVKPKLPAASDLGVTVAPQAAAAAAKVAPAR